MAQIAISKDYLDGDPLFEADLDAIREDVQTFINVTKLNDDNLQTAGITGSDKLIDLSVNAAKLAANSVTTAKILDANVTAAKLAATVGIMPIGSITMFHTFNGAVSIPRGWMKCNGDVVNSTNYESIHGGGTFTTDAIAAGALNAKNLPNLVSRYPVGVSNTTQNGSVAITAVGNSGNTTDSSHVHQTYNYINDATTAQVYNSSGALTNVTADTRTGGVHIKTFSGGTETSILGMDTYTSDAGPTSLSIQPDSIEVIFIIKVV